MTNQEIKNLTTIQLRDSILDYETFGMDPVIVAKMRDELDRREEDELYDVKEVELFA